MTDEQAASTERASTEQGEASGPVQRWRPDAEHTAAAGDIRNGVEIRAADELANTSPMWRGGGGVGDVEFEPDDALGGRAAEFTDPDGTFPWLIVDGHGRRYEIELEVTVRPVAPVAVALREHDADVAKLRLVELEIAERKRRAAERLTGPPVEVAPGVFER